LGVIISAFQSETRERVIGAILLRKPKSLGRWDSYAAVITTQRMIFAQITSDMVKEAIEKAKQQAKAEGKGFLGQWSAQLGATFNYIQKYLSMEPSAIISETPGNFYIENGAIRDIKIEVVWEAYHEMTGQRLPAKSNGGSNCKMGSSAVPKK
jgi:hypothetical protein